MLLKLLTRSMLIMTLTSMVFAHDTHFNVKDAYIPMPIKGMKNVAAYLTLNSTDEVDRTLVSVTSNITETSEIHEMSMGDGRMRMRKVDELIIPENGSISFQPGGYHLMLIGFKKPLNVGDDVKLSLTFKDGEILTFSVPVVETKP